IARVCRSSHRGGDGRLESMRGRRGNAEGSIRKRSDGRWEARLTLGGGTRRSRYSKTRQEVARLLTQAIRDLEVGLTALSERQTIEQYVVSWLAAIKHAIKPRTWIRYEEQTRLHVLPALGKAPISAVTAQQVQVLYARKLEEHSRNTRGRPV